MNFDDIQLPDSIHNASVWYQYTCPFCVEIHTKAVAPLDDDLRAIAVTHDLGRVVVATVGMTILNYTVLVYHEDDTISAIRLVPDDTKLTLVARTLGKQESFRLATGVMRDNLTEVDRALKDQPLDHQAFPHTATGCVAALRYALGLIAAPAQATVATTPAAGTMSRAEFTKLWGGAL